jgi:hypothetical protein
MLALLIAAVVALPPTGALDRDGKAGTARPAQRADGAGVARGGEDPVVAPPKKNTWSPTMNLDRLLLEQTLIRLADGLDNAVDDKDWARARSFFADQVTADFSSLTGQPAATIPADALVEGWKTNLAPSKTSLHLRTNHQVTVEGDAATMISHGYAWNRLEGNGDPLWETWGVYEHGFRRIDGAWKIVAFTYRQRHERGNPWVKATPGA